MIFTKTNSLKSWKATEALQGALAALVGLFGLCFPNLLLGVFSFAVGAGIFIYGAVQIVRALRAQKALGVLPKLTLSGGILAAAAGLIFLLTPATPVKLVAVAFGIWSLVSGALHINRALASRRAGLGGTWLLIQSVIKLAFGFFLIVNPWSGSAFWVQIVGAYLIYLGVAYIVSVFTATQEPL